MRARNVFAAACAVVAVAGLGAYAKRRVRDVAQGPVLGGAADDALAKLARVTENAETTAQALEGLDLARIGVDDDGASAPAANGRIARLTLDADLQRTATALLVAHRIPEAAVVMIEPATGDVLVYASHVEDGPARDLCAVATAPAASVFKIITGSALVEHAGLGPDTRECYAGGGEQRIHASDLVADPRRDKWCVTLAGAMGRSLNTVFARLAQKSLQPVALTDVARSLGFGEPLAFDVPIETSKLELPGDPLGYARTAAGFWNTTLSPLHAAWISATIARGGEAIQPSVVRDVLGSSKGSVVYARPEARAVRRAMSRDVAQAVATMMEHTVSEGTSYKAFHDPSGTAFFPGVRIAGKTGTLTDAKEARLYTWFTGFAPSRPTPGTKTVAIAVLVVNHPTWHVKANVIAREMLRAHLASQKVAGVTRPAIASSGSTPVARPHARASR